MRYIMLLFLGENLRFASAYITYRPRMFPRQKYKCFDVGVKHEYRQSKIACSTPTVKADTLKKSGKIVGDAWSSTRGAPLRCRTKTLHSGLQSGLARVIQFRAYLKFMIEI